MEKICHCFTPFEVPMSPNQHRQMLLSQFQLGFGDFCVGCYGMLPDVGSCHMLAVPWKASVMIENVAKNKGFPGPTDIFN